jgi:prepilin peptidase CpaA
MVALAFSGALSLAMLAVMVLDATRYLIPNSLNFALLLLFGVGAFFLPVDLPMGLVAAAVVLIIGLGLFALGLMGGGDIKLLVVLTLWTGWSLVTGHFLMLTAVLGGILVIVVLLMRMVAQVVLKGRNLPRLLTPKQPVPYGLAIAGAFLVMIWSNQIPALAH